MYRKFNLSLLLALSFLVSTSSQLNAVEAVVQQMQKAAGAFLESLSPELRSKATYAMDDEERLNWHFVPKTGERKGVDLKDLNDAQERKLTALIRASLGSSGQLKVQTIQSLESVLFMLEKADHRDPELYYTTIFGKPSAAGSWGWRLEGHHLSLNFAIADGKLLANSPNFWGANPAKVPLGPKIGLRALKLEEDLARELVQSLSGKQRSVAIIEEKAPKDIRTKTDKEVSPLSPIGIKASALEPAQVFRLSRLIDEYLQNMPADVANDRWSKLTDAGLDQIAFAWAGSLEVGEAHYYRVQGPTFLIEYDNVQNGANHIHAVWRDFDGDFGRDILKEHYQHSH